ncbi:MAG: hypothetical protein Q9159_006107 [Coniocarpon cinnabarinum]
MASNGTVLAVPVALAVVSIVVVGLRFQVRHWRKSGVAVDDWLCIPALLLTVACCGLLAGGSQYTDDVQQALQRPEAILDPNVVNQQKLSYAFIVLQPLALGFIKTSVLCFYRRIFPQELFEYCSRLLIIFVFGWSCSMSLAGILQCGGEPGYFWTQTTQATQCHAPAVSGAFICLDVVLDFIIVSMPIPLVLNLQMALRQRVLAVIVFLGGGGSIPVALSRLIYFANAAQHPPALLSQVWGVTMANNRGIDGIALYCPICEICIALVAACAPSLVMAYSNEKATPGDHANAEAAWRSLLERQKREGSAEVALSNMSPEFAKRPRTGRPSREEDRIYSLREFLD